MLIMSLLLTACATTSPEKAAAIKKDPHNLMYASDSLKRDKQVVLAAVSKIGIAILDIGVDNPLKSDPDVVLASVKVNHYEPSNKLGFINPPALYRLFRWVLVLTAFK